MTGKELKGSKGKTIAWVVLAVLIVFDCVLDPTFLFGSELVPQWQFPFGILTRMLPMLCFLSFLYTRRVGYMVFMGGEVLFWAYTHFELIRFDDPYARRHGLGDYFVGLHVVQLLAISLILSFETRKRETTKV